MIRIGASEEVWDAISMLLTEFVLENHWQISGNADNARESMIELIGVLGKAQMIKTSLGIEGTAGIQIEASKKEWEALQDVLEITLPWRTRDEDQTHLDEPMEKLLADIRNATDERAGNASD